ncbi:hypothetical protein TIFTF001_011355 [Ficus carica]|uniref:Uncharacterized protein n=1 Tax=Ficus carica TaxID=3494 RepID=A0AA88AAA6_FICCA|nr:hypothetical protein TIFTF001_011355 [Ficus carica]
MGRYKWYQSLYPTGSVPDWKCGQQGRWVLKGGVIVTGRWVSKGGVIVTVISPYKEMVSCAVSPHLGIDICDGS